MPLSEDFYRRAVAVVAISIGIGGLITAGALLILHVPWIFSIPFWCFAALGLFTGFQIGAGQTQSKVSLLVPAILVCLFAVPVMFAMALTFLFGFPSAWGVFYPPPDALTALSPDGQFRAYVEQHPSFDPPNQALMIENAEQSRFQYIAQLAEDVDSISAIHWSPGSDMVVFVTRYNLFVVHVPGYETVTVPLGAEWRRHQPRRSSTFSAGSPREEVGQVEFPEPGIVRYSLKSGGEMHTLDLKSIFLS